MAKFGFSLKKAILFTLLAALPALLFAQLTMPEARLKAGVELYGQGKWREAVLELRRAQAESNTRSLRAEALFWISLCELAAGEYQESLCDMAALAETDPGNPRIKELPYHKGRILYYQGDYDEAIKLFSGYANSLRPGPSGVLSNQESLKKAAALYWTGESLFLMSQLDLASDIFTLITKEYPLSPKYEASVYRLALINQKKVEDELLVLLRWTHEEALRNMEDFRRRETSYDQALGVYQKRNYGRNEASYNADNYREQLLAAEERIRFLETTLAQGGSAVNENANERLRILKANAEELENLIQGTGK